MTHMHHLQGWTGVFIGIVALGAAAGAQLAASDTQTILIVGGEIIVSCITGFCLVKVAQLKTHINSRMDELLTLTKASAHAQGVKEGREQQKNENENDN